MARWQSARRILSSIVVGIGRGLRLPDLQGRAKSRDGVLGRSDVSGDLVRRGNRRSPVVGGATGSSLRCVDETLVVAEGVFEQIAAQAPDIDRILLLAGGYSR